MRFLLLLPCAALLACGSVVETPHEPLADGNVRESTSTSALYGAERDQRWSIVRVDPIAKTVTPLTVPLPDGFKLGSFYASKDEKRFVAHVARKDGVKAIYAASSTEWHEIEKSEAGRNAWVESHSPSLELLQLSFTSDVGGTLDKRIVDFEGKTVRSLLPSVHHPVLVGDSFFVISDSTYKPETHPAEPASTGMFEPATWTVFDREGKEIAVLPEKYSSYAPQTTVVDGRLVIPGDTCTAYTIPGVKPESFACDSFLPPFVRQGDRILRIEKEGLSPVAKLGAIGEGALLHHAGDLATFVTLKEKGQVKPGNTPRRVQVITFIASDGSKSIYDPGEPQNEEWDSHWTRGAGDGKRSCAVFSAAHCPIDFHGTCTTNFVDVVCSDGHANKSRRFFRDISMDANVPTKGAVEFTLSNDGHACLFEDGSTLHYLDTATFDEVIFDSPWKFGSREGDTPGSFGQPY